MQLQIECSNLAFKKRQCLICKQSFIVKEARVILCDEQGEGYGELCSLCISKGFGWIQQRFDSLQNPQLLRSQLEPSTTMKTN